MKVGKGRTFLLLISSIKIKALAVSPTSYHPNVQAQQPLETNLATAAAICPLKNNIMTLCKIFLGLL